jgi:hypothetical protein
MFMANHPLASSAAVALQIEVVGSDLGGRQFIERTQTLTVTRDGATILLTNKLAPECELMVRNLLTNDETLARVVGHIKEDASGHVYGIALVDPSVNLWRVQLGQTESDERIVLECSHCHAVRAVSLTEIEMEIFESKRALTRRCECSSSSTIWKQTARGVSEEPPKISPGKNLGPEPVAPLPQEKRRDKRTAVKLTACIRHSAQEEVVVCEDMSRGGFRFKSRKQYPEGTRIEAAVPYAQSSVNIFTPALIAYSQVLSAGSYRHGVAYLKTTQKIDQDR